MSKNKARLEIGGFVNIQPIEEQAPFRVTMVAPTNTFDVPPTRWVFELKGYLGDDTYQYMFTGVE